MKRYISLDCAEKAIRNLINWDDNGVSLDIIKNRNDCLEVLTQVEDYIDIDDDYCPVCRKINGGDNFE